MNYVLLPTNPSSSKHLYVFGVTWFIKITMITSIIFLITIGCFTWLNTSKKAILSSNTVIEQWLQSNLKSSKIIGSVLLIIALVLSTHYFGNTSGFLFWLIALIALLSLVVIIHPLKLYNYKNLISTCIILLTIELIINYAS